MKLLQSLYLSSCCATNNKFISKYVILHVAKTLLLYTGDSYLLDILVRPQNFLNCKTSCLTAVKNMLSSTVKRYMRDPIKSLFWSIKNQVKFWINFKLEISMLLICLLMIFLLFTLLNLII